MKRSAAVLIMLAGAGLFARERINGIYWGENVSWNDPKSVALEVYRDGTVVVHMGATIPGLKDENGQPVHIRRVRTIHE